MKQTSILMILVGAFLFLFTGCDDHDHDNNQVTITIQEPADGEMVATANCGDVHIHADFTATEELHEVKVELHPEGSTSDTIIYFEHHTHASTYTFEQEVNLCSYPSGTAFHLHMEAYVDHDGTQTVTEEVEFTLQ